MRTLKYILFVSALLVGVGARGQYNPSSPAEPGAPVTTYVLTLAADPSGGGSFNLNATTSYSAGTSVSVKAYTASNFAFVSWEEDGTVISTVPNFTYTMPSHDARLIAHYTYNPSGPSEPAQPVMPEKPVYSAIYLTASPSAGGSFNIASGNSYEVGTTVKLQAKPSSNFTFTGWMQDGELLSTSATFNYVVLEGDDANRLTATFTYTPGSPGEPSEPEPKKIYHRVYLLSDPVGGGYFNVESGNQYEEGSSQTFRAYNNQWYTFQNWSLDGEIVSTNSSYTMSIPTDDVTLTAHYTYNYNPSNPSEPTPSSTTHLNIYGMTAVGAIGQNVIYPVVLENTEDVYGVTVVLHFPEGFTARTDNVMLGQRAAGHTISVTPLDGNAYRFDLDGDALLAGGNGKIFEVPVTISDMATADSSYQVRLTNGARLNKDGSKDVITARSGYIYVERVREDGLYAQFSYDKLQARVKFTNLSSDKALSCTWEFGDGTTSTERDPLHVYAAPGYYDVRLIAKGQTGTDVAVMTVLINDENTWNVQGAFFLDTSLSSVRSFATLEALFDFLAAKPIVGSVRLSLPAGTNDVYAITDETLATLTTIKDGIQAGGYTLTVTKSGDGTTPALRVGAQGDPIRDDVVALFVDLGTSLILDGADLRLWGLDFTPSGLQAVASQTVFSGQTTDEVDFSKVSRDLDFSWSIVSAPETASGYLTEGTGNIPPMTATSGSADDCELVYNIICTREGETFLTFTHTIALRPALEGRFTNLTPADGAELGTLAVQLTWNTITNAVYDVYLWNAANEQPTSPVAEGITATTFVPQNFCQNGRTYKWQVVARNAVQSLASEVMTFSINILPDLHVTDLRATTSLEAGQKAIIEWTVRNDGMGSTGTQTWTDRLWLVPDVYSGTAAPKCLLLSTTASVKALEPGESYTASAEVTIDEASYGSYYILAATDMSSVTLIDWMPVGGTIVNPYTPTVGGNASEGTYPYLFATTVASGNKVREPGEADNRCDNFSYLKVEITMPQMDETDWQLLQTAYEAMGSGEGWTNKWNFDVERRTVLTLPGVSILQGHVGSIDLHANGLTGTFPATLLALPALRALNLSDNALTGDINEAVGETAGGQSLETLNIANNKLSGNIGAFVAQMPALTSLVANNNCLSEVNPMIAATVTTLKLGSQTIDKTLTLDLSNLSATELMAQVPTILTYNHAKRSYGKELNLMLTTDYDDWAMQLACSGEAVSFPYVATQNDYHGASGDVLRAAVVDKQRRAEGSTLAVQLLFADGDANFNGTVDITDLQAQINFAFEDYAVKPFNFTAANLWMDDVINVQDVVRMVDILLDRDDVAEAPAFLTPVSGGQQRRAAAPVMDEAPASLYIRGGHVWVNTSQPVASFQLTLSGTPSVCISEKLEELGFDLRSRSKDGKTRIVGYSLRGATLPVGETPLCDILQGATTLTAGVLADSEAESVNVRLADIATGINGMGNGDGATDNGTDVIYDISGRRVGHSTSDIRHSRKGVYILNGRKVVK